MPHVVARCLITLTLAVLALAAWPARAELAVGRDYVPIIPAQTTESPAKIEVLEFFSYGCPHCSDFNPLVAKWAATLPGDVVFKRVPVSFGRWQWANLAKLYYALEVTGDLVRLDAAVFETIHKNGNRIFDDKSIAEWASTQGVDARKFADAYNSFGVASKVKRAEQMVEAYKISGVPAMTVDGKYLVTGKDIGGLADLLALTTRVVEKTRGERKKK